MKKKFEKSKLSLTVITAALALNGIAIGCGKADAPPPEVAPVVAASPQPVVNTTLLPACPSGQRRIGNGPCVENRANFAETCWLSGGFMLPPATAGAAPTICRLNSYQSLIFAPPAMTGFPRLTPDAPAADTAWPIFSVKRGDTLFHSAEGGWGHLTSEKKKVIGIPYYRIDCQQDVSVEGVVVSGASVPASGSLPAGLLGSDGVEAFLLGSDERRVINNDGILRVGFNAPAQTSGTPSCAEAQMHSMLAHCEDAGGTTYPCPDL